MKEAYSYCVGCDTSFFLTDRNIKPTIGSPEFDTICHKHCCGKSESCKMCSVFAQAKDRNEKVATKNLLNIVQVAIQSLTDDQLEALDTDFVLNVAPLIAAEQDKRSGNIKDYQIRFSDSEVVMRIIK